MIFLLNIHKNKLRNNKPNKVRILKMNFFLETQRLKVIEMRILNNELERKNLIELFSQKFI